MDVGRKCCLLGTAREVLGTGRLEKEQDHLGASWLHKHSWRFQGKEKVQLGLHCGTVKILGAEPHRPWCWGSPSLGTAEGSAHLEKNLLAAS